MPPPRRMPFDDCKITGASFYYGCAGWARRMTSEYLWRARAVKSGTLLVIAPAHLKAIQKDCHAWIRYYRKYHTAAVRRANQEKSTS